MKNQMHSRRRFIGKLLGISALVSGSSVISSCNGTESKKESEEEKGYGNDCDDLSGVSESEIKKREALSYVKESNLPGSHCGNCNLYIPPKEGEKCGGCLLFKGPVHAEGYCVQYEAKA